MNYRCAYAEERYAKNLTGICCMNEERRKKECSKLCIASSLIYFLGHDIPIIDLCQEKMNGCPYLKIELTEEEKQELDKKIEKEKEEEKILSRQYEFRIGHPFF